MLNKYKKLVSTYFHFEYFFGNKRRKKTVESAGIFILQTTIESRGITLTSSKINSRYFDRFSTYEKTEQKRKPISKLVLVDLKKLARTSFGSKVLLISENRRKKLLVLKRYFNLIPSVLVVGAMLRVNLKFRLLK